MSYLKNQISATKMLTKFGQPVVITSEVVGTYDTSTGSVSVTKSIQSAIGAVFDWGGTTRPSYGEEWLNRGLIQIQDRMLLLSATGITPPNLGDTITLQGKDYSIVPPLKIEAPAGIPIFIVCNIRGI